MRRKPKKEKIEFTYRLGDIANTLGVSSQTLKNFIRDNDMVDRCIQRYGKLRIPVSFARELLGLPEDSAIPIVRKKQKRRKTALTMKDIKNLRTGGIVFDYEDGI